MSIPDLTDFNANIATIVANLTATSLEILGTAQDLHSAVEAIAKIGTSLASIASSLAAITGILEGLNNSSSDTCGIIRHIHCYSTGRWYCIGCNNRPC